MSKSNSDKTKQKTPTTLYGYQVQKFLGEGGMSKVYRIADKGQVRNLAIKIPKNPDQLSEPQKMRFILEAKLMGQLQHPAIPPIYKISESHGEIYYTMKQIRGRDLKQILQAIQKEDQDTINEFPRHRLLNIFVSICQAVAFCHTRGVIHRDLKPENIMIGDFDEIQVIDFGLAKAFGKNLYSGEINNETIDAYDSDSLILETATLSIDSEGATIDSAIITIGSNHFKIDPHDSTQESNMDTGETSYIEEQTIISQSTSDVTREGKIMGTLLYMSPEQAQGKIEKQNHTSDIYALGATLWDILIGSHLRKSKELQVFLKLASLGRRPNIEKLHLAQRLEPELKKILLRATEPIQKDRYQTAKELGQDIQEYLDGKRKWKLVYQENFRNQANTETTPDGWITHNGHWKIQDGALSSTGNQNQVIHLDKNFHGDLRLEFTASLSSEGEIAAIMKAPANPITKNKEDGYFFEYGADDRRHSKLARDGQDVSFVLGKIPPLIQEVKVITESINGIIRMECDGKEIFNYRDLFPLKGSRVGFYAYFSSLRIHEIKVHLAGTSRKSPYIGVPDALFEVGAFEKALFEYTRLRSSFPGSDQADQALYKSILCQVKLNNVPEARQLAEQLKATTMAPLAYIAISQINTQYYQLNSLESYLDSDIENLEEGLNNCRSYHEGQNDLILRVQSQAEQHTKNDRFHLAIKLWVALSKSANVSFDQKVYAILQYTTIYRNIGQYDKLHKAIQNISEKVKNSTYGKNILKHAGYEGACRENKFNLARDYCQEIIKITKNTISDKEVNWAIGITYSIEGRFKAARRKWLETFSPEEIFTTFGSQHSYYIESFLMEGRFDEAKIFIEESTRSIDQSCKTNAKHYLNIIQYYLNNFEEAQRQTLLNINTRKELVELSINLTINMFTYKKQFSKSLEFINEFQNKNQTEQSKTIKLALLLHKGHSYFYLNQFENAEKMYLTCIDSYSSHKLMTSFAWLGLIRLKVHSSDLKGALAICEKSLKNVPYLGKAFSVFLWSRLIKESIRELENGFLSPDISFIGFIQNNDLQGQNIFQCFGCQNQQWKTDERGVSLSPLEILRRMRNHDKSVFIEMINFKATYDKSWIPYTSENKGLLTSLEAWEHFSSLRSKFNFQSQAD